MTIWGAPLTGKIVRNVRTGMVGEFLRYGDANNPTEAGTGWVKFKGHGAFSQSLGDLEACEQ